MSIHRSLRGVNTRQGERSVLTRFERVEKMIKDGRIDPKKQTVVGLPKMRTKFRIAGAKKVKVEAAAGAEAKPAEKGAKGAAPAAKAPAAKTPAKK
jgi:small basic protein (TIGR04137 family)